MRIRRTKRNLRHDYEQGWSAINELIRADGTWSGFERNVFYANNRDGTFSDVSGAVGLDFLEDGRAFALADFDHDGRQEVFLKNRNGPQLRILKNVMENLPPSIAFRLRGTKSNRDAIGAAVTVETESGRQTRMLQAGSGFLSQHSKEVFFGLGRGQRARAGVDPLAERAGAESSRPSAQPQGLGGRGIRDSSRSKPSERKTSPRGQFAVATLQETEPLPTTVETWLLAPVAAPDFSLPDLTGQLQTLAALRGNPVLLNFWVTQSTNCQEDLKVFNRVYARWSSSGSSTAHRER